MSAQNLEQLLQSVGNPVDLVRNSQIGPYLYPGYAMRVHELAGRAARVARDLLSLRPVVPHDRHVHQRAGRPEAALGRRGEQLRELRSRQGEAADRLQQRRVRDRRRDPLLPRGRAAQPRRPALGAQLGPVPLRDRWLRRDLRARRARCGQPEQPQGLPLPAAGPERAQGAREAERRAAPRDQVLQHGLDHDRRTPGARAAPRHVGRPRPRGLRPLGGRRRGQGGDPRGRRRVRHRPRRLARLRDQHARVGLDPVPAAGDLHRRRHEGTTGSGCPRRATREPARSAAATTPTTSPTTTSRRTTSATARS